MKLVMSDVPVPISPSEIDRKLLLDTLDNMDVVKSGGKVVQGLVNRRSREKDNAEDINPAFPAEVSEDADLSQIQKRAALNLLFREESSGGQNLGLETEGNTVGRYHIQQDKAALVNPEIKDMTTSEYHRYIINNPEVEEKIVSKYIDIEIDKMLKNSGVDKSRLRHNEYASIVSNLYNKGNQPKLLQSAAKLTSFRKNNPRDKRFTEKPYFEELKGKSQNINQTKPIADTGSLPEVGAGDTGGQGSKVPKNNVPVNTELDSFPAERVIDIPEKENKYEGIPFLHYKPVQKLLGLAEGGAVPMKKQMEMFEDGGLMDEGGTVDPVSGNDVPPGSTQEEVRDDIPAQLSEGEFVFPADVVRYIGLGNLMQMRQEAKMGLKLMDEMGQMGNSEEATIPDDLPFDINDLDIEDEIRDNSEAREMQVGGFVQPTQQQQQYGISGFQQAAQPTTGFAATPVQAASQQFVQPIQPQQAAVPTMQAYKPAEIPTFTQTIGASPGQYDEMREYKNEAGEVRMIPFKAGQPIYPIPEGFTYVDPEATKTEEVTTTPTTPQTTSVRQDASKDERQEERAKEEERIYGPGGGRLSIGEDTFGVSFDMPEGFVPGMMGAAGTSFGLLTGKPLPAGVNVNFKYKDDEFTLTSGEYNRLKQSIQETGSKSAQTKTLFNDLKQQQQRREDATAARLAMPGAEQQIKEAKEAKDAFEKDFKSKGYVIDKKTGAFIAKPGATLAERKAAQAAVNKYAASMATDDDEDEAADNLMAKEQRLQAAKEAGAKRAAERRAEEQRIQERIRNAEAAQRAKEQQQKAENVGEGGSYSGGSGAATGGGGGAPSGPGSRDVGGQNRGYRAKGGLMEKEKPKTKKMKKGGLASKK